MEPPEGAPVRWRHVGRAGLRRRPGIGPTGSAQELACRVITGEFGNGAERKRKLGARYEVVQKRVNELLS